MTDPAHAEPTENAEPFVWRAEGMDCASCVAKVERAIGRLPGVAAAQVNLLTERLTVSPAPGGIAPEAVERQVAALGYRPVRLVAATDAATGTPQAACCADHPAPVPEQPGHVGHAHAHAHDASEGAANAGPWWRAAKARLVWLLAGLVVAAWLGSRLFVAEAGWIFAVATLIAVFPFGRRAFALARAGSPFSIETLMSVAALGAVAIGAAEEAAIVVLLFAIGELLENVAAGRARAGIQALAGLMPPTARVERAGTLAEVPAETLRQGEIVQVRPGDRIPCDGDVLEGQSAVDESPVTGESIPVSRGPGEAVLAGSVNTAAVLRVRVTAAGRDNTISRIVRMVEEATASRAPTQRFIEKFAIWWTPGAMAVSALVMLLPPLAFGADWWTWIYRGLAVLLIACPCALVISVPAAMASGLSAGARRGLLIKGGAALETIGKAVTVAFDKTGTLTAGRPRVTDIVPLPGTDEAALLAAAASVEAGSAHPLARAILEAAVARGIAVPAARQAGAVPGKAATALVEGRKVAVGSPRYAEEQGIALPNAGAVSALEVAGKTVVVVLTDGRPIGLIALRDEARADAAAAIDALKALGLSCVMLTGDNERAGGAIASALGMDVRAHLLPAQKLRAIEALKARGPVVMVGDGINDAPALAAASVGVAMGGGTAVALETADAAVLRERVSGVAELIVLSRATLANVKQNVVIAVGLKLVVLATTLLGVTGLWMAILADTGATVLVTMNALRLLHWHGRLPDSLGNPHDAEDPATTPGRRKLDATAG